MTQEIAIQTENSTSSQEFSCKEVKTVKPFSLDVNQEDKNRQEDPSESLVQTSQLLSSVLYCSPYKEELQEVDPLNLLPENTTFVPQTQSTPSTPAPSPSVSFSPQIEELFIQMASQLILLKTPLEETTILYLDAPQFAHSPFYGTKLIIKEYSTAPLQFNVELAASTTAAPLLAQHQNTLFQAFERSDFNFSIKNLTVCLNGEEDKDRPLFHRKEKIAQDGKDSLS